MGPENFREANEVAQESRISEFDELPEQIEVKEAVFQDPDALLDAIRYNPDSLLDENADTGTRERLHTLRNEIIDECSRTDIIEPTKEMYPEYAKMLQDGIYESVEDLCNQECLNYEDVYDSEPKEYGAEFKRGLSDYIVQSQGSPFYDSDELSGGNEAYSNGARCAARAVDFS